MYTKDLIEKIESVTDVDQTSIKLYKLGKISRLELEKISKKHCLLLKELISAHGFPFKDTTSEKAYLSAFLITQHSNDMELMENVVDIFSTAKGFQINKAHTAYLVDRIRLNKGLLQLYGTQFIRQKNGTLEFHTIEDEENVDKRRKEMGMSSLEEYRKLASQG